MKFLHRLFIFTVSVLLFETLQAQSQKSLAGLMQQRDEYYFRLEVQDTSEIQAINALCSVDATNGVSVVCYANQAQYDNLLAAGYQPTLLTPPSLRETAEMYDPQRGTYEWDAYLTYPQYVSMMEGFPASAISGRTCTFLDLGTLSTSNHRKILGVRINNGQPDGKPKFLYTSTMHGDEVTGMILMLRLIDELCTSTDSRIINLLDNLDIFIFPCTNPDGTYYGGNNTVNGARRYNGNNIDLNRHFPDFDDGAHPDGASYYQDEAQWMMDLAQQHLFTMGANYHGGAEVMNYPWDTYQPVHPDDAWWRYICLEYAQLAQSVSSSYMTGTSNNGIINGYAWYTITGSRQDYMNYYAQCREVTIECSNAKTPSASQLPNFWNYNHNSMLTLMEQCLNGVHGVVMDANTGQPIEGVTVTVMNHDHHGSSVTSHAVGDFHRPIKGGNYTFKFTKEGYCSETVDVTATDEARVDLTVYLTPSGSCPVDCYEETALSAPGSYIMGYRNGNTFVMPTNSSGSSTTTSVTMTPNGDLLSIEQGEIEQPFTVTSAGTSGQYYISYNGYYLTRNTSGYGSGNKAITWSTSQGNNSRWTISGDGITQSANSWMGTTTYYLFYNNGAFFTGTSNTNNITFLQETDCPVANYTVNVSANPTNGGTVAGGGSYAQGQSCTVTASPNANYTFNNWTENGTVVSTNANYTFTVNENHNLVAHFTHDYIPQDFTISVSANPEEGGTVIGGGTFQEGQSCTVIAEANEHYAFENWTENGEIVSEEHNYTFTVNANHNLVANFTYIPQNFTVTVAANPTNGGTVSGGGTFQEGSSCTVSATANANYTFNNWTENGIVVSTNANYTFTVNEDHNLVAHFTHGYIPQDLTISVSANPEEGGTVVGGGTFQEGQSCTVIAEANEHYAFENWTENGEIVSEEHNYTFTVNANHNLVANFTYVPQNFTVTVAANPTNGGTVSGGGTFQEGSSCTVHALPANGYSFINWTENGSFVSSNANFSFSVNANRNLVAHFSADPLPNFTISVAAKPSYAGTVVGGGSYQQGQSCTVTATPANGFSFVKWTENDIEVSSDPSFSFSVNANRSLVANFDALTYVIAAAVNPAEGGSVVGGGTYEYGQQVTLKVLPNNDYVFVNWTENGNVVSEEQDYSFSVNADRTLVANLIHIEGVDENRSPSFLLFPNPVSDMLTVEAREDIDLLEIFNLSGALVYCQRNCTNSVEIHTSDFAKGTYIVRLTTKNYTETRKFVKK